ncbi:hypothetical protein BOTNAR_0132g00050 [Botryotinia narcissicola]|uniref:Uncharacterized protein n=1 Tax=Botryotinia narcissicola TaxID=278944 RepID=A0A4Z1IL30_9HELO|nr:hypothetical protein BOTNAR_0132g00050 [Botryotinia narcissicola]
MDRKSIEGLFEYIVPPFDVVPTENPGHCQDPRDRPRENRPSGRRDNHQAGSATRRASQGQGHHNSKSSSSQSGASNSSNERTPRHPDIHKDGRKINGKPIRRTSKSPSPPPRHSYQSLPPDLPPAEPLGNSSTKEPRRQVAIKEETEREKRLREQQRALDDANKKRGQRRE